VRGELDTRGGVPNPGSWSHTCPLDRRLPLRGVSGLSSSIFIRFGSKRLDDIGGVPWLLVGILRVGGTKRPCLGCGDAVGATLSGVSKPGMMAEVVVEEEV
jgi:hypothetical protein